MEFSPGKELHHTKMDLEAMQDVTRLLQNENNRLRQVLHDTQTDFTYRLREVVESKATLETTVAELRVELEHNRSERARLEAELVEAVGERRRQAELLKEVRKQVDGRLSKLMEELHKRDEEVHRLEYVCREKDRGTERLTAAEHQLSSKQDALDKSQEALAAAQREAVRAQQEAAGLQGELRVLRERLQSLQQQQQEAYLNNSASVHHQGAVQALAQIPPEATAVFPLYRQWATDIEKRLLDLEDMLEAACDAVIDIDYYYSHGVENIAAIPDRRRLAALRRMDRERLQAQHQVLAQTSANSDNDATALTVQAIRGSCDASRYTLGKTTSAGQQLKELIAALQEKLTSSSGERRRTSAAPVAVSPSPLDIVNSLKKEVEHYQQLIQQQRDAVAQRDAKITELTNAASDGARKLLDAEASVRKLDHECAKKTIEIETIQKILATTESDLQSHRLELAALRTSQRSEREDASNQSRDLESRMQQSLRAASEAAEKKVFDTKRDFEARLRVLEDENNLLRKENGDAAQREERLKSVLEESRQKRLALKRQRDEMAEEVAELRQTVTIQARELQQSHDMIQSLTNELDRTKLALEFEVRQQEAAQLNAATSTAADSNLFREWKQQHNVSSRTPSTSNSKIVMVAKGNRR